MQGKGGERVKPLNIIGAHAKSVARKISKDFGFCAEATANLERDLRLAFGRRFANEAKRLKREKDQGKLFGERR